MSGKGAGRLWWARAGRHPQWATFGRPLADTSTSAGESGKGQGGAGGGGGKGTPMTQTAASRVQGAEARQGGGGVEKGGFAARAQVRRPLRRATLAATRG